jgi:hypothetical protein
MEDELLRNLVTSPRFPSLSVLVAVSALIAVPGCASTPTVSSSPTSAVRGSGSGDSASPAGGCGDTPTKLGGRPSWMPAPDDDITPYVVAVPDTAAVILTVQPLRAGHATNPSNKVAWVVRVPRSGTHLSVDARPLGQPGQTVHFEVPPVIIGAGEVYTSDLDLPSPGCWTLTLRWGSPIQTATVNLVISPA